MVTWHLILFTAKCYERATLRKLWRETGNSSLLPVKCWPLSACDQSVQLKVGWCCRWNHDAFFSKFALVLFCHITSGPNKIHCPPRDQLLSVLRDDCGCHGNDLSPPLSRPHFPSSWSKSPNSSLWLANRAGIRWRYLSLSCPLGFTPCPTWKIWLFISYIKSFTEQACSVKMAGCWLFFGCLWISTPCQFARKERSQYPAVLTDNKLYLK